MTTQAKNIADGIQYTVSGGGTALLMLGFVQEYSAAITVIVVVGTFLLGQYWNYLSHQQKAEDLRIQREKVQLEQDKLLTEQIKAKAEAALHEAEREAAHRDRIREIHAHLRAKGK